MNVSSGNIAKAINIFDLQYRKSGIRAQRMYPNEALIQFMARNYNSVADESRKEIKVLEVGCGSGANLWMLAKEGFDAYGLDGSNTAVEIANAHLKEKWGVTAKLSFGDFTELPYEDRFFDAVVDVVSLQHLDVISMKKSLFEIGRILKPNGKFFSYRLGDHSIMYLQERNKRIDPVTVENIDRTDLPLHNNGPTSFWSPSLANVIYSECGLKIDDVEVYTRVNSNGMKVEYLAISASHEIKA